MSDPFLGELRMISWNYAPRYWAFCDGATMAINQNQALFALLGTQYGGNGVSNFQLPDLRSRVPMGFNPQQNTLAQTGGEELHTLAPAEVPIHTHTFNGTKVMGLSDSPGPGYYLGGYEQGYVTWDGTNPTTLDPSNIAMAGGGQGHENRQPYLCIPFIIALSGIFPSRN